MRTLFTLALAVLLFNSASAENPGKVFKVLPLLLDKEGRTATSPSLYDRDAYQAFLHAHADQISAVRYDVEWRAKKSASAKYVLRLELRSVSATGKPVIKTFASPVTPGIFHQWTSFTLDGEELKRVGSVVAWHATLLDGATAVGEQKSFLW